MAHKVRNQKVDNLIPGQYVTQNLGCLVPLPTMEGKLQAFLCPPKWEFDSKSTMGFLDSSEHLRRC